MTLSLTQVSARAQAMLARGHRHPCPTQRTEIVALIEQAHLPVYDAVVAFQERWGGVEYWVGQQSHGTLLGIAPSLDATVDGVDDNGRFLFECADRHSAQVFFRMDHAGIVYICAGGMNPTHHPIASSIEMYIESDAVEDEMLTAAGPWPRPRVHRWHLLLFDEVPHDDKKVDQHIDLPLIPEASDAYTTWWKGEDIRIRRCVDWTADQALDHIYAYTRTRAQAKQVCRMLAGADVVACPRQYRWP